MQPTNYTGMLNPVDPGQALLSGIKTGAVLNEVQLQNQQRELQQQQLAQQKADLGALVSNPNPSAQDYANYTLKYPSQAEAAGKAFSLLDTAQQQQKIGVASRVYGALQSGRPDLADQILAEQETAQENGGNPGDLQGTKVMRQLIQTDPQNAIHSAGLYLSSIMGPKNFAGAFGQLSTQQQNQATAPLKAAKTEAEIGNLQSQITNRAADTEIKRADIQIKALNAKLRSETNDIERQKLQGQIQDAQTKRDQLASERQKDYTTRLDTMNSALDTVSQILAHPGFDAATGLEGTVRRRIAGTDAYDAGVLLEQLQSQQFTDAMNSLKGSGLGALSDAEGKKINSATKNIDAAQSPAQLRKQLTELQTILNKHRQVLADASKKELAPHEGIIVDTPHGGITQSDLNAAAKRNGISPEKMLELIKASGGQ